MATKSKLPEPHFFKLLKAEGEAVGRAEGKAESNLETARKMVEHGLSWEAITNITGLKPADLKTAAKAVPARKLAKK